MDTFLPHISVIIPTYNGAGVIGKTLESLANQSYTSFELVVVIDGSTDETEEIVNEYRAKFPLLKMVLQQNKGRSGAKNSGAFEALGELLIFYDDDVIVEGDSIQTHFDTHRKYQNEIIVGGNPVEESTYNEFLKFRAHLRSIWVNKYPEFCELNKSNLLLSAANFSIPRKIFLELNGFDESFSDAEDFDLVIRAYKKGIKIYFDKSNIAFHDDQASVRTYIKRRRQYENARKQLCEKHPDFLAPLKKTFFKRIIYFIFSFEVWVKAIEKEYLKFLPQKLRYKIYTLTIWGLSQYFPQKKL